MPIMLENQVHISLSSKQRTNSGDCINGWCSSMPLTIPNIFPSDVTSEPVSDIALQVVEVSLSGVLNLNPGSIHIFNKRTGIEVWDKEQYSYEAEYCETVDDLISHINEVLPDKLRLSLNENRTKVRINYKIASTEKAQIDCSVLLINTNLASKLGFRVPNLQSTNKTHSKFLLYPETYPINEVDINCTIPRCSNLQPTCSVAVNAEVIAGTPGAADAGRVNATSFMANLIGDLNDLDTFIEGKYRPSVGAGLELLELEIRQANLQARPGYLKSPRFARQNDSAVVSRLDLSSRNVNSIKPTDTISLRPNEPLGIICSLKSSSIFMQLSDVNGQAVSFDKFGEILVIVKLTSAL